MSNDTLGARQIHGERSWYNEHKQVEQYSEEKFNEMLNAVFDASSDVQALQWRQYTPYFNDGDACVFHAWMDDDATIALGDVAPDGVRDYDDEVPSEAYKWVSKYDFLPDYEWVNHKKIIKPGQVDHPAYKAFVAFTSALDSGHFDNVVNTNFGDPAKVCATRNNFYVEHYDHD